MYRCAWRKRAVPLITENIDLIRFQQREALNNTYQAKEREVLVREAVSRLPQAYRCVIEFCDFQQMPMREAATQLGLTLPAINSRRDRAKQKVLPLVKDLKFPSQCD